MSNNHMKDSFYNKSLLSDLKEKIIEAIKKIKREIDECWDAERETIVQALDLESHFDDLEQDIRAEYQNLHRFLEMEEDVDVERLRKERHRRLKPLKEREKKISEQGRDLQTAIETLNNKLKEEDSITLLNDLQDLIKRCQVNFRPPPVVSSEVHSGEFVGPLQYRVWKNMKKCLYPNISSLTFDSETAHPLLNLSPSLNSVWFEENKMDPDMEPNPQRFTYYYCVMGRQGFTHGRHYWEVQVSGKTAWRIGVARQDVHRGKMDPCTSANGLWTLALKNGVLQACTHPYPTHVLLSVHPTRIGLFLDCEKEEVSFYDATTMTTLFTFTYECPLVPLCPFFNPCDTDEGKNSAPLAIFTPSL